MNIINFPQMLLCMWSKILAFKYKSFIKDWIEKDWRDFFRNRIGCRHFTYGPIDKLWRKFCIPQLPSEIWSVILTFKYEAFLQEKERVENAQILYIPLPFWFGSGVIPHEITIYGLD